MQKPLADRLRPECFDDIAGQVHLVGPNGILRRLTEKGRIPNMVFFGPPGTGKTTVANIIAKMSGMQMFKFNIVKFIIIGISCIICLSPFLIYYLLMMFDRFFVNDEYSNIIDIVTTGRLEKWKIYLTPWYQNFKSIVLGLGLSYNFNTKFSSHSFYFGYLSKIS